MSDVVPDRDEQEVLRMMYHVCDDALRTARTCTDDPGLLAMIDDALLRSHKLWAERTPKP